MKLGDDLKSDICGICCDDTSIYAGIRNGSIARIKKNDWSNIKYYPLSDSSIWDMKIYGRRLYAGNVGGHLLSINTESMEIERNNQANKKNINSLCLSDQYIITASQDKSLSIWSIENQELLNTTRKTHKKAFIIGGYINGKILTVSFRCSEIKVFDIASLAEENSVSIKGCLTGEVIIDKNILYVISRAIAGVECTEIDNILP